MTSLLTLLRRMPTLFVTLGLLAANGCIETSREGEPDTGSFSVVWAPVATHEQAQLAELLRRSRVFEPVVEALNSQLKLPRDVTIKHTVCGEINAFYDPTTHEILMCYELLEAVAALATHAASDESDSYRRVIGPWLFIVFHELGHALIDLYGLPITGKEEDAVDDFSAVLMVQSGWADLALLAAEYWGVRASHMQDAGSYADEHSFDAQRFYSIACLVYGSDPRAFDDIVSDDYLPVSRAQQCPYEYGQKERAWTRLLAPWSK